MTSWSTITLQIEKNDYGKKEAPTSLLTDSGIHEQGWLDENRYYALSFGRHQQKRFDEFLLNFHCPKFSGIKQAIVCKVNDTGDTVEGYVYNPKQKPIGPREDGYYWNQTIEGDRWPVDQRNKFKESVVDRIGLEPVVEPIEDAAPLDMLVRRSQERFL